MLKLYVEDLKPMIREKYIDLHTHTTFSDGTYTPYELVREAKEKNLSAIAITDHDCVDGIEEGLRAGEELGVEVISGIEFATNYTDIKNLDETEIHIVGLFLDYKNPCLLEIIQRLKNERNERNITMSKKLTDLGFPITFKELMEEAGVGTCTRAHYANLMVKKGYIGHKKEAFHKYIGSGKPGYVPRTLPTPKECIDIIKKSGGVAILAHATLYGMDVNQIRIMAKNLKELDLKGMEIMYSTYMPQQEKELTQLASDLELLPSGGSDFHGSNKPDIFLGVGRGNLRIPYEFLENLRKEKQKHLKL